MSALDNWSKVKLVLDKALGVHGCRARVVPRGRMWE